MIDLVFQSSNLSIGISTLPSPLRKSSGLCLLPEMNLFSFRSLSRCIEPLLFFQFRTSDNRISTFEVSVVLRLSTRRIFVQVPIKRFNELRYNTALLLKEMEDIESKQGLKLLET